MTKAKVRAVNPAINRAWILPMAVFTGGALALMWSILSPSSAGDSAPESTVLTERVQGSWKSHHGDGWRQQGRRPQVAGVLGTGRGRDDREKKAASEPERRKREVTPKPEPTPVNPRPKPEQTARYRLKDNDRLWNIAHKFYGDGSQWQRIVDRNPGLDPARLKAGTLIEIPMNDDEVHGSEPETVDSRGRHHVVRDNETLYTIARKYRPRADWNWLYEANREVISDPDRLRVGIRLRIPNVGTGT